MLVVHPMNSMLSSRMVMVTSPGEASPKTSKFTFNNYSDRTDEFRLVNWTYNQWMAMSRTGKWSKCNPRLHLIYPFTGYSLVEHHRRAKTASMDGNGNIMEYLKSSRAWIGPRQSGGSVWQLEKRIASNPGSRGSWIVSLKGFGSWVWIVGIACGPR